MVKQDLDSILWMGAYVMDLPQVSSTAATIEENYDIDDLHFISAGTEYIMEIKTVKHYMGSRHFDVQANRNWITYDKEAIGKRVWMLNLSGKNCAKGRYKYHKVIDNPKACLCYIFRNGLIIYNNRTLKNAYIGEGKYRLPHTTNLADREITEEVKALIDLSKGKVIRITPPSDIFE